MAIIDTETQKLIANLAPAVQAVANTLSVIVAVAAIAYARRADARAQRITQRQIEVSTQLIRPVLGIYTDNFESFLAVHLRNKGAGTAIVTSLKFSRGGVIASSLPKLTEPLPAWDHYWVAHPGTIHVAANENVCLGKLSLEVIASMGYDATQSKMILERIKLSLNGIVIECRYTDILEKEQVPINISLAIDSDMRNTSA